MNRTHDFTAHQLVAKWTLAVLVCFLAALLAGDLQAGLLPDGRSMTAPRQITAVIPACDPIAANTTWTTGNVYVAQNCTPVVLAGATLTIQPGVVVKFGAPNASGMRVDGRLIAQGTAAQPIVFTSYADDSAGGDTNGNGPSSGAPGDWYGLVLTSGSQTAFDRVSVRYAGGYLINGNLDGWNEAQIEVKAGAQFTLTNSEVRAGGRMGVYLNGAGLTPTIQSVQIADHTNTEYAYRYALLQSTVNMQPAYANLTFSGNTRNEVTIGDFRGELTQDVTLGGANFGATCGYTLCHLTVPAGRTLTVAPGAHLAFDPAFGIAVAAGGTLRAEGTAGQPIVFTSTSTTAYWIGLWAQQGSTLRLSQCDISYADDGNYGLGALEINTSDAVVANCRIHHNRRNGVYIWSRTGATIQPTLQNVEVTDNGEDGLYLNANLGSVNRVTWEGGRVADNGYNGVRANNFAGQGVIDVTLRQTAVTGNGSASGMASNQNGFYAGDANVTVTMDGVSFHNNAGTAVYWQCNGSITARNLTAAGNGADELRLIGCAVSSGRQWDLAGVGIPTRVTGGIEVTAGGLLSIMPGTTLRFDKNPYDSPTYLAVYDQAALFALGTADQPVIFTGATPTPGWWTGIEAVNRSQLTLRHCRIAYAGSNQNTAALKIRWGLSGSVPTATIQNCEIDHSARKGAHFDFANFANTPTPIFRFNNLHDNAEEAVANWNAPVLDARQNYWGHPSGPFHATVNPGGQGNRVGDNILFYPWLTAPDGGAVPGEVLVATGAPTLVSPGQAVDYAVQVANLTAETLTSPVLLLQLPRAADYVSSTAGGVYRPETHQVFWLPGDIPPGGQGFYAVRVQFAWGLPADFADGTMTLLSADNYNAGAFDRSAFQTYQPVTADVVTALTQAQFDALRAALPNLQALYQEALGEGYAFLEAGAVTYSNGQLVQGAVLRTADRQKVRLLTVMNGQALAVTSADGQFVLHDATGGMREDLQTHQRTFWGNWTAPTLDGRLPAACTETKCKFHCIGKVLSLKVVTGAASKIFFWTIATGGTGGLLSGGYQVYSVTRSVLDCRTACNVDPYSGCCDAEGQARWSPGLLPGYCGKAYCNATTGTWGVPGQVLCDGVCIALTEEQGGGCKQCETSAVRPEPEVAAPCAGGRGDCTRTRLLLARDPNDITGLEGDLLPGQTVTYTIRFENEGAGRAYGVYVVNQLPEVFDAATLNFVQRAGVYLAESREIVWAVGELGPKGAPDSQGTIVYTVALTAGLPSGTVIANQAVVYFPSVPEETPTNTWVNLIAPLTAEPQTLTTTYMTPRAVTLRGRDVSGSPLTYEIVALPRGGVLTGAPPNVTYTPAANFSGPDAFSFRVNNGTAVSRPAQVRITVTSAGDTTPPQVLWTNPAANAVGVVAPPTAVMTDTLGPLYGPAVTIAWSEPLDPATVTPAAVQLMREGGAAVTAHVRFDAAANQIVLLARAPLAAGRYTVTVTTAVRDLAGNAPTAPHNWSFTVGSAAPEWKLYLPIAVK